MRSHHSIRSTDLSGPLNVGPGDRVYPAGFNKHGKPHEVGSFGGPVIRSKDSRPMMLTAAHVVGSLSAAHLLDQREVLLGAGSVSPASVDIRIGEVIESHPPAPCDEIELDACLVEVDPNVKLGQVVRDEIISGRPRDLSEESDLIVVYKRGINLPGLTEGLLDPTFQSLKVALPGQGSVERDYLRGWFVHGAGGAHPFARAGDSGSIVVDEDDCPVAMIVALRSATPHSPSPDDPAFVIPIIDVLEGMDVRLVGPDRPCIHC